jgi:hypothetical protein
MAVLPADPLNFYSHMSSQRQVNSGNAGELTPERLARMEAEAAEGEGIEACAGSNRNGGSRCTLRFRAEPNRCIKVTAPG